MSRLEESTQAAEQEWLAAWGRGPSRLRWTETPLQVGDFAPNFTMPDQTGKPVELKDFWAERPGLILFWRHFGCSCGMDRARRLKDEAEAYQAAGAQVVIVGQGEPERSEAYREKHAIPYPILSDPTRSVYQAYGLLEGGPAQILFDASEELLRCDLEAGRALAAARRAAGRPMVDSPWQLPGEFVVDRKGRIRLTYRYQYCEDYPNPLVLVAAVREAHREFDPSN